MVIKISKDFSVALNCNDEILSEGYYIFTSKKSKQTFYFTTATLILIVNTLTLRVNPSQQTFDIMR